MQLIVNFAEESNMLVTNIHFRKRKCKQWAYISERGGVKSQVDCILIGSKWKSRVKNCKAFICFSSIGSGHCIVTSPIKLRLRVTTQLPESNTYDWSSLRSSELQNLYNERKNMNSYVRKDKLSLKHTLISSKLVNKHHLACFQRKSCSKGKE